MVNFTSRLEVWFFYSSNDFPTKISLDDHHSQISENDCKKYQPTENKSFQCVIFPIRVKEEINKGKAKPCKYNIFKFALNV